MKNTIIILLILATLLMAGCGEKQVEKQDINVDKISIVDDETAAQSGVVLTEEGSSGNIFGAQQVAATGNIFGETGEEE